MAEKALQGLSVLVVEDEVDARELVVALLEGGGATVYSADAVSSALAILATHTPDVLISDIAMAEEDGYSLMRRVRALNHHAKCRLPAIALTAFTRDVDRAKAFAAGFDMHMGKPLQPAVLVQNVLDLSRMRRAT